jgi:hypothetical protein
MAKLSYKLMGMLAGMLGSSPQWSLWARCGRGQRIPRPGGEHMLDGSPAGLVVLPERCQ